MTELRLPGLPNIHCHAFQRAMAGLAERQSNPADSFWTWREMMYRFASRIDPDTQYAIAAQLYVEMLEAGYTRVCEFHYLHHQPDGQPYAEPAAMSQAVIAAARDTGIGLTLLPVLYMSGGFDGRPLSERQRRFGHGVEDFLTLVESLRREESQTLRIGIALHSLRAVPPEAMAQVLNAVDATMPVHIHIAEQTAEVDECMALRGARPVEWLLANADVDERWTLVHATHVSLSEVAGMANAKAVVAICPTTEANLGDGLFPLRGFIAAGGRFGIGSDSNVSVSPVEELRWLEYGQRLVLRERNIAATPEHASSGESLYRRAVQGGVQSCAQSTAQGDRIVLDESAALLVGVTTHDLHDRFVFAGNCNLVRDVYVAGRQVVQGGRHAQAEMIKQRYQAALGRLLAD